MRIFKTSKLDVAALVALSVIGGTMFTQPSQAADNGCFGLTGAITSLDASSVSMGFEKGVSGSGSHDSGIHRLHTIFTGPERPFHGSWSIIVLK